MTLLSTDVYTPFFVMLQTTRCCFRDVFSEQVRLVRHSVSGLVGMSAEYRVDVDRLRSVVDRGPVLRALLERQPAVGRQSRSDFECNATRSAK